MDLVGTRCTCTTLRIGCVDGARCRPARALKLRLRCYLGQVPGTAGAVVQGAPRFAIPLCPESVREPLVRNASCGAAQS